MAQAPSRDVRRQRFSRFVTRALASAKERGLTVPDIERATGVSKATFYRWRSGDWTSDPRGTQVRQFCDGLGINPQVAYDMLGWNTDSPAREEPPMDPDVEIVLRALADPNVSAADKEVIRGMLRMIAAQQRRTPRKAAS